MTAKTRQQIAMEYGICTKTLTKWLKNAEIKLPPGIINPYFIDLIYSKLGTPNKFGKP